MKAVYNIGYGVYILTTNASKKNGCVVNSVAQITSSPARVMVCVNKENYSCSEIQKSKVFNLSILDMTTAFSLIEKFGFSSGKDVDKFENFSDYSLAENGVPYITKNANSYLSLKVVQANDVGTHMMFVCDIEKDVVLNSNESITYAYYQNKLKPQKKTNKTVWVCSVCGYVYEDDPIPEDFVCPLCKHGASDFVRQGAEDEQKTNQALDEKSHVCLLCGYTYKGEKPPSECPVCGQNMWKSE